MRKNFKIALQEIRKQGYKPSHRKEDVELLKAVLLPVMAIFEYEIAELAAVFVYRQQEQTGEQKDTDGITLWFTNPEIYASVSSVGVSVEALRAGEEYATMVFLHELAHVRVSPTDSEAMPHDRFFHSYLDRLIARYNQRTGKRIENDYFGL